MHYMELLRRERRRMAAEAERVGKKVERYDAAIVKIQAANAMKDKQFEPGDRIRAWRLDTMAKDQVLSVIEVRRMPEFRSGYGVKVRIGKRAVWLCSGLFYMVNVLTHPPIKDPTP